MDAYRKWLSQQELSIDRIDEVEKVYADLQRYMKGRDLIICEVNDNHIKAWLKQTCNKNLSKLYKTFNDLNLTLTYLKEKHVEINFNLTKVFLELKGLTQSKYIKKLIEELDESSLSYELSTGTEKTESSLVIKVEDKKLRVMYADFDKKESVYISYKDFNINDYDYYYVVCMDNNTIRKRMYLSKAQLLRLEKWDYFFEIDLKNHEFFDSHTSINKLKTS